MRPNTVTPMGPLTHGKPGKHFVMPPQNFTPPTRYCAASVTQTLELAKLWAGSELRPGCRDFMRCESKGIDSAPALSHTVRSGAEVS